MVDGIIGRIIEAEAEASLMWPRVALAAVQSGSLQVIGSVAVGVGGGAYAAMRFFPQYNPYVVGYLGAAAGTFALAVVLDLYAADKL